MDVYVGGAEHATRHLIYARFWHNFLHDIGVVSTSEPFKRLHNVGLILAEDGRKMSKRFGNVVNPDEVVGTYGADAFRIYEMFMGPFNQSSSWDTKSIMGSRRFVERIWRIAERVMASKDKIVSEKVNLEKFDAVLHSTIVKVTNDIENFNFNTAISSLMILSRAFEESETISKEDFAVFLQLLAPFAPHVTDELWRTMGNTDSVHVSSWPIADQSKTERSVVKIGVQVNGKVRDEIEISIDTTEDHVKELVLKLENVKKWLNGANIKRVVFVKNKLVNIVTG